MARSTRNAQPTWHRRCLDCGRTVWAIATVESGDYCLTCLRMRITTDTLPVDDEAALGTGRMGGTVK